MCSINEHNDEEDNLIETNGDVTHDGVNTRDVNHSEPQTTRLDK